MNRVRTMDEWVARLSTSDEKEQERALEALSESLGAADVVLRERTAQFLLQELARPGSQAYGPILSLLQTAWWPPPERLAASAFQSVTAALARMDAGEPAVDDAALVLANVCRVAPAQLAVLEGALGHAHPAVRRAAVGAVGRVGEGAVALLPKLLGLLNDEESVAGTALETLGALASLAPDVATPVLLEQARTAEGTRLYLVLTSLRSLVEDARRAGMSAPALPGLEPVLHRAVKDAEPAIRVEAVTLLGLTKPASPGTLTALGGLLRDANPSVAACAAVALLRVGAPPQEALGLLQNQLSATGNTELQGAALSALEEVEPATLGRAKAMLETVVRTTQGPASEALRELLGGLR